MLKISNNDILILIGPNDVDDHTVAISVSAVTVVNGFRIDLTGMQAIARKHVTETCGKS